MKLLTAGLLAALAIATMAGCTRNQAAAPSPKPDDGVHAQQAGRVRALDESTAARLERIAESVPHVRNATVVVFGKTAIVGIDVDGKLDRSHVGTLKYTVAEALHKDPNGARAAVTADMDINERLREIRQAMRQGRPLAGFMGELADIVGRIMPQFPSDTGQAPGKAPTGNRLQNRTLDDGRGPNRP